MTTQKTYISQLTPELNPCTIKVKVLRAWCYREAKMPATHRHFEMIVVDEKGDKIHVIVNNCRLTFLQSYFNDDMVVLLRNFSVIPNNTSYKYTKHPYKISYDGFATACRSNTFDADVNKIGFELTKFCDIISLNLDTEIPVDIEGEIFSWECELRDYEVYGCKTKMLPLKLKDTL
ncbi:replication protein A 70 kDa DNA-binding subunit D [Artemisia annua]|uniref:Replication protein A 70 kDa DNA-binding subunit D n=1 Tax=Artemisia annua TaxID=35608 RepID=A0A2U1LR94_ARTAN|nr:replication protein A 70 kDa DNA-binding subunit D [Artemisia annua]